MGSYISSWLPWKSQIEDDSGAVEKKTLKNSIISYFLSWGSVKNCGYCDRQLPSDGQFTTCPLCKEGFHFGNCSDKRSAGYVKKLVKKFSCPECFSWKVGSRQSAKEVRMNSSQNSPLHKDMKHMFKPHSQEFSSTEKSLKRTRPSSPSSSSSAF